MASKNMAELQKDTFRNKSASFGNEKSVSGRSPEDLSGAHHEAVFFCEDPDFDEFGEEVDPIGERSCSAWLYMLILLPRRGEEEKLNCYT